MIHGPQPGQSKTRPVSPLVYPDPPPGRDEVRSRTMRSGSEVAQQSSTRSANYSPPADRPTWNTPPAPLSCPLCAMRGERKRKPMLRQDRGQQMPGFQSPGISSASALRSPRWGDGPDSRDRSRCARWALGGARARSRNDARIRPSTHRGAAVGRFSHNISVGILVKSKTDEGLNARRIFGGLTLASCRGEDLRGCLDMASGMLCGSLGVALYSARSVRSRMKHQSTI